MANIVLFQSTLSRHLKHTHYRQQRCHCIYCDKDFYSTNNLKRHLQNIHQISVHSSEMSVAVKGALPMLQGCDQIDKENVPPTSVNVTTIPPSEAEEWSSVSEWLNDLEKNISPSQEPQKKSSPLKTTSALFGHACPEDQCSVVAMSADYLKHHVSNVHQNQATSDLAEWLDPYETCQYCYDLVHIDLYRSHLEGHK